MESHVRRRTAWVLTALVFGVACLAAYPYVRYRPVTSGQRRSFEDRWHRPPPGELQLPLHVAQVVRTAGSQVKYEAVYRGESYSVIRERDSNGDVRAISFHDGEVQASAKFGPDGEFLRGERYDVSTSSSTPLGATEARELLKPYLEPNGMPWQWWTRLPFFAGHLHGE